MSDLSERLMARRKSLVITQQELSQRTGLTPAAISMIESGDRTPNLKSLIAIADALDVSLDWIAGRPYQPRFENFPKEADKALRKIEEAYSLLVSLRKKF